MNILHITTGFPYTKVYKNLFHALENDVEQTVFVPKYIDDPKEKLERVSYDIIQKNILTKMDKIFFLNRIKKVDKELNESINVQKFDVIHAHSLMVDGAVAYNIFKKKGIPYIVAVRDTDLNKYLKYGIHLKPIARKIISNASKVIFLSESYKEKTLNFFSLSESNKMIVIPNGIDDFFIKNRFLKTHNNNWSHLNLLFVGKMIKRKNLPTVIKAVDKIRSEGRSISLFVVGDGILFDNYFEKYNNYSFVKFLGKVKTKERLRELYINSDILVVPSYTETFGLVYAEALSVGTPVIYTREQGFDRIFEDGHVGYSVDPDNVEEIVYKIKAIIKNYEEVSFNAYKSSYIFDWNLISEQYVLLYKDILY